MEKSAIIDMGVIHEQAAISNLQAKVGALEQIDIPVTHTFSGGIYIREIIIPKGVVIVGKRHRHETCNILMKGELLLYATNSNSPPEHIKGPLLFTSPAFAKKAALCIEEAVFMNIHPTKEIDLDKIEAEFIIPEHEYFQLISNNGGDKACLGQQSQQQ